MSTSQMIDIWCQTWSILNFVFDWCQELLWFSTKWNLSLTNCTDSPLFTLNISMVNFWRFLSWVVMSYLFQEVLRKYIGGHYIQFLEPLIHFIYSMVKFFTVKYPYQRAIRNLWKDKSIYNAPFFTYVHVNCNSS